MIEMVKFEGSKKNVCDQSELNYVMLKWNEFSKRKRKLYKWNSIKCFSTHTSTHSLFRSLARSRTFKGKRTDDRL